MKLKPRTTYWTHGGRVVNILEPAMNDPMEGQPVFRAVGGRLYAEDGRLVVECLRESHGLFLAPHHSLGSIAKESLTQHDWNSTPT